MDKAQELEDALNRYRAADNLASKSIQNELIVNIARALLSRVNELEEGLGIIATQKKYRGSDQIEKLATDLNTFIEIARSLLPQPANESQEHE